MNTILRACLGAIALSTAAAAPASAQPSRAALVARLDSIAGSAVAANRAVGLVAAVVRGNDTLLLKSYGRADVEWSVPMPTDAMFEIGSIAKQITAAAILRLRDEGKLGLDDDLTRWLPDFDTRGHRVPLRRLLDHTSGIHDYTETREFAGLVGNRAFPRDSAYALIQRHGFDFAPGEAQTYSNSGFWLLALVVEKASGRSYEDYVEQTLFAPLGMTRSMHCNSYENVARRAHGYGMQNGTLFRAPMSFNTWFSGAGGLCSTAADLVTWMQALHGGRVLSPASYAEMTAPSTLANGMALRYGLGIGVGTDGRGFEALYHGGILAGFRSEAAWYPAADLAIVVLTNTTGGVDPEGVAGDLAAEVLPRPRPSSARFDGDAALLVGRYRGRTANGEMTVEVTQGPEGLLVSGNGSAPRPLTWTGDWTFLFNGIRLTFHRAGSTGPATELGFNPAKRLYFVLRRQSPQAD